MPSSSAVLASIVSPKYRSSRAFGRRYNQTLWTDHHNDLSILCWRRRWLSDGIVSSASILPRSAHVGETAMRGRERPPPCTTDTLVRNALPDRVWQSVQ